MSLHSRCCSYCAKLQQHLCYCLLSYHSCCCCRRSRCFLAQSHTRRLTFHKTAQNMADSLQVGLLQQRKLARIAATIAHSYSRPARSGMRSAAGQSFVGSKGNCRSCSCSTTSRRKTRELQPLQKPEFELKTVKSWMTVRPRRVKVVMAGSGAHSMAMTRSIFDLFPTALPLCRIRSR